MEPDLNTTLAVVRGGRVSCSRCRLVKPQGGAEIHRAQRTIRRHGVTSIYYVTLLLCRDCRVALGLVKPLPPFRGARKNTFRVEKEEPTLNAFLR